MFSWILIMVPSQFNGIGKFVKQIVFQHLEKNVWKKKKSWALISASWILKLKWYREDYHKPSHKDNVQTQETVHIFKTVAFKYSYHTHKKQYVIDMLISLIVLIY